MEEAGPQLLFDSVVAKPTFRAGSAAGANVLHREYCCRQLLPPGSSEQLTVQGQWAFWQRSVVKAFSSLTAAFDCLGMAPAVRSTAAVDVEAAEGSEAAVGVGAAEGSEAAVGVGAAEGSKAAVGVGAAEGSEAAVGVEAAEGSEAAVGVGAAEVSEAAEVAGVAEVSEAAEVAGVAEVSEAAEVAGVAEVSEAVEVAGGAEVSGAAEVAGVAEVSEEAEVAGGAEVSEAAEVAGGAEAAADTSNLSGDAEAQSSCNAAGSSPVATARNSEARSQPSSTSSPHVKWGYLLQLQQHSPQWAAAAAAFDAKWPNWRPADMKADHAASAAGAEGVGAYAEQLGHVYTDVLGLCRALAAAVQLPVVCNNPSCDNLAGVSDTAAACKACAGCKCRYCSAACQRSDWRRHKGACRRMAAAGVACA
jgi:hypothetical protein